jgi:hypothetical protein
MGLLFSNDGNQGNSANHSSSSYFEDLNAVSKNVESFEPLSPKDRARAAIVGAFVADSLSAYSSNGESDDDKFINSFDDREQTSGTPMIKSASPHSRHLGHQSFYGEEAFPFLQLISTR